MSTKTTPFERLKLHEIATRICEHLKRFENDPKINVLRDKTRIHPYFNSYAVDVGRYCQITYVSFQGHHNLTKAQALAYLRWLNDGNEGKHYKALEKAA